MTSLSSCRAFGLPKPSHILTAICCCLLFSAGSDLCLGQSYKPLCVQGSNRFQAVSHNQVEVVVAPAETAGFGTRACNASLKWGKQSAVVADQASEADLDLFDVTIKGLGSVAAFEIKQSSDQCCASYQIYAIDKPVRLLRTLRGGSFHGADTDMDGRVEIWAEDRAGINGLEGLLQTEITYPPTFVLRFQQERLLDASAAFQDYFDRIIAEIRHGIDPEDQKAFQQSDGMLRFSVEKLDEWKRLHATKIKVLEIVWAYLYSGRENEAWNELRAMWPQSDINRIQAALVNARSNGILAQIDGVSHSVTRGRSQIFDNSESPSQPAPIVTMETLESHEPVYKAREVKVARPIYLWRPMPQNVNSRVLSEEDEWIDLVIDSAGKVRSVHWVNQKSSPDEELLNYALTWKFIPALRRGKSVASRLRLAISLKR